MILIPCQTGRGRRGEVHVPAVPEGVQLGEWREVSHQQDTLPGESEAQKSREERQDIQFYSNHNLS